ncbi:MAG: histidine phosphatase family protein [Rhodospirillales bacterium]
MRVLAFSVLAAIILTLSGPARASEAGLWQAVRAGEAFAIMRHAYAPGFGDPDNFALGDCSTQRNLNDQGRDQARAIGERFRANGIDAAYVVSSEWCRCRETAELLGLGDVEELPALNSFFANRSNAEPQTADLREWLASQPFDRPLVLVTHQVNISALTGRGTSSGEIVVVQMDGGRVEVLGSIATGY